MSAFDAIAPASPGISQANTVEIRAALPVLGGPHKGAAQGLNWLLGRGHPLVVCGPQVLASWQTWMFSFWVHPDDLHPNFLWDINLSAIDAINRPAAITGYVETTGHDGDLSVINGFTTTIDGTVTRLALRENVTASNTPQEIHITIQTTFPDPSDSDDPAKSVYLVIHGIHVSELPETRLDGYGVALSTLDPRQPIYYYNSTPSRESIASLPTMAELVKDSYARRGAIFSWWTPFDDELNQTTSTSYVEIFPVRPSVQTRLMDSGQERGTVKVNVAARCTSGTGQVRVTMTSGDSVVFDVSTTSVAWIGEQSLLANCDQPDRWETDGGIRGGVRDDVIFEFRAPSGGTMSIRGLMITESPTEGGEDDSANVLVDGGTPVTLGHEYIFVPIPYP
jgi:hypothetical protein